jgi:hypothetical protein
MITKILEIENERRKMLLELVQRSFSEASAEGITIPQIDKPDGFKLTIRLKEPESRSIIIRPRRALMTNSEANFLLIFMEGIQTARRYLSDPPLKGEDFQGTILLSHKGVEGFLKGEKTDPSHL